MFNKKQKIQGKLLTGLFIFGLLLMLIQSVSAQTYPRGTWPNNAMPYYPYQANYYREPKSNIPRYEAVDISTGQVYDGYGTYYDPYYKNAETSCSSTCNVKYYFTPNKNTPSADFNTHYNYNHKSMDVNGHRITNPEYH